MAKSLIYIGLLVTFVGAGITVFVFMASDSLGSDTYNLYILVDNANGLLVDTEVRVSGIKVGRIEKLELEGTQARITIEIKKDLVIHSEDSISRVPEGVLGASFLEIKITNAGYALQDGDRITNVNDKSLIDSLSKGANKIVDDVSDISTGIKSYLDDSEFYNTLDRVMLGLAQTISNINKITEGLVIDSQENANNVRILISSLSTISYTLEQFLSQDKTDTNQELSDTLRSLKLTLQNIEQITKKINEGEGTLGKLVTNDSLYEKADSTLEQINKISSRAAGLYTNFDYNYAGLFSEADGAYTSKNNISLRISPANSSRYYTIGITSGGTEAFTSTPYTSTIGTSKLKLNLELAQTFKNWLTIHGGLIENTGGFGITLKPISQLDISSDIFNFGGGNAPAQLRAYLNVYPFFNPEEQNNPLRWIYFGGGAEDILNSYGRAYFFNVGLRIHDEFLYDTVRLVPLASAAGSISN